MCEGALHWTEYFKAIGPTLIAVFVAYIAYQQWKLRQDDLRQKLFQSRMEIFDFTEKVRKTAFNAREPYQDLEAINEIHFVRVRAQFLFGNDVNSWFTEMYVAVQEEIMAIDDSKRSSPDISNEQWREITGKKRDAAEKRKEIFSERDRIFSPYLDFSFIRK